MIAVIIITFIFTISRVSRKSSVESESIYVPHRKIRNVRIVLLLSVFLILMPFLVFSIGSIARLDNPDMKYAQIPQESRIEGAAIDFSKLEYYSTLDGTGELSFNSKFISKSQITTFLGEASTMRIRLVPENVTPVDGRRLKESYDITSKYITGPHTNYDLITQVPLDSLKYCHFHYLDKFPIYDRFARIALSDLIGKNKTYLNNYFQFKKDLDELILKLDWKSSYKEIDKYLWLYGQWLFYKEKKSQNRQVFSRRIRNLILKHKKLFSDLEPL